LVTNPRDRSIDERLARRAAAPAEPPRGSCLDAETAAAWFDGTLDRDARHAAEVHAASCARCQTLLATIARTDPVAERRRWWQALPMRWLVPATAAIAAGALWVAVVPHDRTTAPSATVAQNTNSEKSNVSTRQAAAPTAAAPTGVAPAEPRREVNANKERREAPPESALADKRAGARPEAKAADAIQPAAPSEASDTAGKLRSVARFAAPMEITSPDPLSRWTVQSGVVSHSTDGGVTWSSQQIDPAIVVAAGASPSRDVAWLVARGGIVLISADGKTWQQHSVGENIDLVAVRATDAKTATVTAADGREFTTHDGGVTWSPRRSAGLQELSTTPF
jgi:hypothetical protein